MKNLFIRIIVRSVCAHPMHMDEKGLSSFFQQGFDFLDLFKVIEFFGCLGNFAIRIVHIADIDEVENASRDPFDDLILEDRCDAGIKPVEGVVDGLIGCGAPVG